VREFLRFALFLAGALVLFVASAALYWEHTYATLRQDGRIATATVTRVDSQGDLALQSAADKRPKVYFVFQTADGRTIQSKRTLPAADAHTFQEGAEIAIRYMPQAPSMHEIVALAQAQHEMGLGRWLQYLMFAFVGAGVMFWVSDTARLKKPRMNLSLDDLASDAPATATANPAPVLGIVKRFR
jgi:Protein of unknown function (DUF3592)